MGFVAMWQHYFQPQALDDALALLARYGEGARIVAGGTDIIVELSRGIRPTSTLIDVTAIPGLRRVDATDGIISLGALTTHNDVVASQLCRRHALPLAQACWEVGAPQIRARGTIAGNLITASPANDTITPLVALDAAVVLTFAGPSVDEAGIALGSLAPTIVRAGTAEDFLIGKTLTPEVCSEAAALACTAVAPIDDIRGTATYRLQTLHNLLAR